MVSKLTSGFMALAIRTGPRITQAHPGSLTALLPARTFSVTSGRPDIMEFFDVKKNWGEKEIKVGRSWKVDELRLKSNPDLHKLWYVLLKEKNMLLTMEEDAKTECRYFANPERIDKVEESMENIETIVRERNRAYHLLETGKTGERPGEEFENWLGLQEYKEHKEYPVPKDQNKQWHLEKAKEPTSSEKEKQMFHAMLRQKQKTQKNKLNRFEIFQVIEALKLFPNLDLDFVREKFPTVYEDQLQRLINRVKERNWENNTVPRIVKQWNGAYTRNRKFTWRRWYGLGRR